MAIVVVTIVAILMLAVRLSVRLDAAARARTAADAAALAGAAAGELEARALAEANGGELLDYTQIGQIVIVVVEVGSATHEARAEAVLRWTGPIAVG